MKARIKLDENDIASLESHIPELAQDAVRRAYLEALTTSGKVVEAINGKLVVTSRDGSRSILRTLANKPIRVEIGQQRVRKLDR